MGNGNGLRPTACARTIQWLCSAQTSLKGLQVGLHRPQNMLDRSQINSLGAAAHRMLDEYTPLT